MVVFVAAWFVAFAVKGFGPWYTAIPLFGGGWISVRYVFRLADSYL